MGPYFLDTDTFTLFSQGHAAVTARVQAVPSDALGVTVITVDEVVSGWYTLLRRATQPEMIEFAYDRLGRAVADFAGVRIIGYSVSAILRFNALRKLKLNVKANDLRIAAIALEVGAVVVTHNVRDFARVQGLTVEDWATDPTAPPRPPAE